MTRLGACALVLLTVGAFVLRLAGMDESLYGDELFAYVEVHGHSLAGVFHQVTQGQEHTPPLYFLLARATIGLGSDPTVSIRLPSLVLGTLTVPVVYLLGQRTVGRSAGVLAATFAALSPLAVYFSTEARPYATLMFFGASSTLALVIALEKRQRVWWVLFWAASTAAIYTHYTAVTVLAAQGAWALWAHREQARQVLFAYAAIAVAYLPYVPSLTEQHRGGQNLALTSVLNPLTLESFARHTAGLVPGYYSSVGLAEVPGRLAMWLLGIAVALALLGALARAQRRRREGQPARPSKNLVLVIALALAAPIGVLLYSLIGPDIYISRHLIVSLPATVILLGALFIRLPRPLAAATTLLALAALTIGLIRSLNPSNDRPPFKQAAHYIDAKARPKDPVVEFVFLGLPGGLFARHLEINFERHHPLVQIGPYCQDDPSHWKGVKSQRRVFVVERWPGGGQPSGVPTELQGMFRLEGTRMWRGRVPVIVLTYESKTTGSGLARSRDSFQSGDGRFRLVERRGRDVLVRPSGREIEVVPGAVSGFLDRVRTTGHAIRLIGWSATRGGPATEVVAFRGGRALASVRPSRTRPDIVKAVGPPGLCSGFEATVTIDPSTVGSHRSRLRVFGVVGDRASELPRASP